MRSKKLKAHIIDCIKPLKTNIQHKVILVERRFIITVKFLFCVQTTFFLASLKINFFSSVSTQIFPLCMSFCTLISPKRKGPLCYPFPKNFISIFYQIIGYIFAEAKKTKKNIIIESKITTKIKS